jgi:hypothetical protein
MKYIGLISSDARGKNGGNVASRNRYGTYLRRHVSPVQPRTASQVANRQAFGAISGAWRALTASEQQGWNTLATTVTFKNSLGGTYNPTGAQLFMLFSRYLIALGGTTNATAPTTLPSIPALTSITPTVTVSSGAVSAISLAYSPTDVPAGTALQVQATKAVSSGVTFTGKSLYRNITFIVASTASPADLLTGYTSKFGTPPTTGNIGFRARLIDTATGYPGPLQQAIVPIG